jgi:hypothetical protein
MCISVAPCFSKKKKRVHCPVARLPMWTDGSQSKPLAAAELWAAPSSGPVSWMCSRLAEFWAAPSSLVEWFYTILI